VAKEGIGIPEPREGEKRGDGIRSPVRHETPVSQTLKQGAAEHEEQARIATDRAREVRARSGEESVPARADGEAEKRHGDALLTGTGTRHGVSRRGERPDVCDSPGE
jgi:hypothetical protein